VLWIITLLLLLLSIPAVYSASAMISHKSYQGDMHFLVRQIFAVIFALSFVYIFSRLSYKNYLSIIKIIFPIVLFLLILTLFSGTSHNNAKRWIELPIVGIELQTSEIAKIALIILVTSLLASKRNDEEIHDIVAIGAVIFYVLMAEVFEWPGRISTWEHRIEMFFGDEESLNSDETYQLDVAKMAIVNGGFWGAGPGNGTVRYLLPQSHSDFIFAFIIEEYGLWMAILIILLYGVLFYRGIRIARKTKSLFAAYLALGLTIAIVLQAFINIGVSVGALPVTGQTLPLISMGRTSLLVTSFSIGVIINISKQTEKAINEE